jgi:hypothetical protein
MSICANCGKEVSSGAAFCLYCGASLNVMPPPPPPPPPSAIAEIPISYQIQTATIPFDEKASRLELIVRIIWNLLMSLVSVIYGLAFGIIIFLYSIAAGILNIINFIKILITGKRWKTAFDWQAKLISKSATYYARLYNYGMRRAPYLGLMTDKRPSLGMEPEPSKTPGGSPA